jgi:hypothetical protein
VVDGVFLRNVFSRESGKPQPNEDVKMNNSDRRPSDETVRRVRRPQAGKQGVPHMTVWRMLRKRLTFRPYTFQLLRELNPNDRPCQRDFTDMLKRLEEDNLFLDRTVFNDEAIFHLSVKVNRHSLIIWGSQNTHEVVEHVRDSPKVNVFCAVSRTQVYGPFFSADTTITDHMYSRCCSTSVLHGWIRQQDMASRHFNRDVVRFPNKTFPERLTHRGSDTERL